MKTTAPTEPGTKMTIRVYTVDRHGLVTEDRGTVSIVAGEGPLPESNGFPPCTCRRCRAGRAVTR